MNDNSQRILILAEEKFSPLKSNTANGAIAYMRENVLAVVDSTKAGRTAQDILGYGGDIPVIASVEEGLQLNPTHLLIGIAPPGGRLPGTWRDNIKRALSSGVSVLSGLHTLLTDDPDIMSACRNGAVVTDYRRIPAESEVVPRGSWTTRTARVVLTVGTDCNIGKMTTLLQIMGHFRDQGVHADFVATGQTGIMIRGRGIAVDSIISDYTAGCIEREIDQSVAEGYEYILVEGQGALTHQGYSGVTLGLIHGSMPDAYILCHQPTRLKDDYGVTLPSLANAIRLHETVIEHFKPAKVIGIAIASIGLSDEESIRWSEKIEQETGLPTVDTFRFGGQKLADAITRHFGNA